MKKIYYNHKHLFPRKGVFDVGSVGGDDVLFDEFVEVGLSSWGVGAIMELVKYPSQ